LYIGSPALPLKIKLEEAIKLIEDVLKKKHWQNFSMGEMKLVLEPFYFFDYSISEGLKVIEKGSLALNALEKKLDKTAAANFSEKINETTNKLSGEYPIEVKKIDLDEEELKQIIGEKIKEKVKKGTIEVSNIEKFYSLRWETFVTVKEKNYKITVSGVSGTVIGAESVPERERGFVEITRETLQELKQPSAWLKYSKEIVDETKKLSFKPKPLKEPKTLKKREGILYRKSFLMLLAIIIIILVLFML